MIRKRKMEDTIEKRIMKSNLSDEDKIEIIKRLNSGPSIVYIPQELNTPVLPPQPLQPTQPWYTYQPYCFNYCTAK